MKERILMKRLICLAAVAFLCFVSGRGQRPESQALFPVAKDGRFGFINRAGRIAIPLQFDSVNDFHEGLALVTSNGKMMFIDTTGKIILTPQFDIVNNFAEGLAAVNIGQKRIPNLGLISDPGKWGYIDKTGKLVIRLRFTHAENFSEGLAAVTDGERGYFIDTDGTGCVAVWRGAAFG